MEPAGILLIILFAGLLLSLVANKIIDRKKRGATENSEEKKEEEKEEDKETEKVTAEEKSTEVEKDREDI